jgi:hypothetical protein
MAEAAVALFAVGRALPKEKSTTFRTFTQALREAWPPAPVLRRIASKMSE